MTTREYANRDGFRFRFGRTGSDNAYVETEDGQRYIFGRFAESELAEFFGARKAAQPDRDGYPRVQGICPSCGVGPLFRAEEGLITCSWVDCEEPDAAANLLADPPEQPDRPEPVDPASVRVGDVVTVEADDGSWTVRGDVDNVDPGSSYPFRVLVPHMHAGGIWPRLGPSNIRILRAAEPEPDEAAVEALADALVGVGVTSAGPDALGYARALIRHCNVQVASSDG